MKKNAIFVLLLLSFKVANSQNSNADKINKFIIQAIEEIKIINNYEPKVIFLQDLADFSPFNDRQENMYQELKVKNVEFKNELLKCNFIADQIKANQDFKFSSLGLNNITVINYNTIKSIFTEKDDYNQAWKKLNATFNLTQGFISCSVPLFFDNDSKAIFSYGIHCGPFCEKSSIVLFEQINGTWKQSKILEF